MNASFLDFNCNIIVIKDTDYITYQYYTFNLKFYIPYYQLLIFFAIATNSLFYLHYYFYLLSNN